MKELTAVHAIITPTCRDNRGDDGAFDEAVRRIREQYHASLAGWRRQGHEPNLHLRLTVERPLEGGHE